MNDIKENAIDFIYCLGDMIGIGPFSNEVLETLFIRMITGNNDESVLAICYNKPYPESRVKIMTHHK